MSEFQWPNSTHRTLILGRTGSGKSVFAAHLLSNSPFDKIPYVIIDYKNEDLFNSIDRSREIDFKEIPKHPGIYILKCLPDLDDYNINDWFRRVLARERVGVVIDEGYMVPHKHSLRAINGLYTQGRSKHIPVVTLSQRPVEISRWAISEADYIGYLPLRDKRDRDTIDGFIDHSSPVWNFKRPLPKYHMRWQDNIQDRALTLLPAPDPSVILQKFDERLKPKKVLI